MVNHTSLGALEEAQQQERTTARLRIDLAEEYIASYRSRIDLVRESFYSLSAREGVSDDPAFRSELQRVSDVVDENVRHAGRMVGELEEDYHAMTVRQADEHEAFVRRQRADG